MEESGWQWQTKRLQLAIETSPLTAAAHQRLPHNTHAQLTCPPLWQLACDVSTHAHRARWLLLL